MLDVLFWGFMIFLGVCFVLSICVGISKQNAANDTSRELSIDSGPYGRNFISEDGKQGVALSQDRMHLVVLQHGLKRQIDSRNIISVEVMRDGATLTKTNRGSQVGGALVGAALLGPVGLLLGGVTGTKRQVEKLRTLTLRIVLRNEPLPYVDVRFYEGPSVSADQIRSKIQEAQDALSTVQSVIV